MSGVPRSTQLGAPGTYLVVSITWPPCVTLSQPARRTVPAVQLCSRDSAWHQPPTAEGTNAMAAVSYDLVIVGAGSGNALPTDDLAGWRIALVESDRFGGTCLNRGCIPSKMLVYTADVPQTVGPAGRFGIRANWKGTDWPAIRERVFGRIDPLHAVAVDYRCAGMVDVFLGEARFAGPKLLRVGDDELRADKFVLATGSRPHIPPIAGLSEVPYVTSDTVMRLEDRKSTRLNP